ncbi:MAG TPA: DUF547 domain-containing protein [Candidatus Eisenbacteria bacterium]|nr:DUF547 domain-containing protein [Candidatus Eisenbacteria bacterium]
MTRSHPAVLALLAALLVAAPAAALPAREQAPDPWRDLLQRYCVILHPRGQPFDTRFDYVQLYVDEGIWRKHRSDRLDAVRAELLDVQPSTMAPRERLAWALNTYNFLVVERATLHLLVPGRMFMRYSSVKEMSTSEGTFFEAPVATIEGQPYSLAGFVRRFVFGDTAASPRATSFEPRLRPADPRLGWAIAPGALGTPPLLPWPYTADSLDRQLDRAVRIALELPRYVRADVKKGELEATNWFFDQRADYGYELADVVRFLGRYGTSDTRKVIRKWKLLRPTLMFEVNWKLNVFERPGNPAPPGAAADSTRGG